MTVPDIQIAFNTLFEVEQGMNCYELAQDCGTIWINEIDHFSGCHGQIMDSEAEHLHELYIRALGQKTPEFTCESEVEVVFMIGTSRARILYCTFVRSLDGTPSP